MHHCYYAHRVKYQGGSNGHFNHADPCSTFRLSLLYILVDGSTIITHIRFTCNNQDALQDGGLFGLTTLYTKDNKYPTSFEYIHGKNPTHSSKLVTCGRGRASKQAIGRRSSDTQRHPSNHHISFLPSLHHIQRLNDVLTLWASWTPSSMTLIYLYPYWSNVTRGLFF